ncbi:hypothetical protein BD770DRAFT_423851 [Pilaira anomala]|nr:hypothetical protein BD770DRAFT_423851 [Pilaira anomala]
MPLVELNEVTDDGYIEGNESVVSEEINTKSQDSFDWSNLSDAEEEENVSFNATEFPIDKEFADKNSARVTIQKLGLECKVPFETGKSDRLYIRLCLNRFRICLLSINFSRRTEDNWGSLNTPHHSSYLYIHIQCSKDIDINDRTDVTFYNNYDLNTESSNSVKRKSAGIIQKISPKTNKTASRDKIKVKGLQGTLGSNLINLSNEIVKNRKSKYFSYQIALLGGRSIQNGLNKYIYNSSERCSYIYKPNNDEEIILKKFCVHVLYPIAFNSSSSTNNYLKKCSEQTLLIRYWANIFEFYFNRHDSKLFYNVFLKNSILCQRVKCISPPSHLLNKSGSDKTEHCKHLTNTSIHTSAPPRPHNKETFGMRIRNNTKK